MGKRRKPYKVIQTSRNGIRWVSDLEKRSVMRASYVMYCIKREGK